MTTMTRYASAILVASALAGCSSGATGSPTPQTVSPALVAALSGVAPAALGDGGDFEFGDTARIRELAAADRHAWGGLQIYSGSGPLSSYGVVIKDVLGVDFSAATSALDVGAPPRALVLITGGQDAAAITAAATRSGWTGSGTLTRALDLSTANSETVGLMVSAPKIRPTGSEVALGGASADLSLVGSGAGAAGGAVISAGTNCLGDVVVARGTGFVEGSGSSARAVGVRVSSKYLTSVICLGAESTDQASALAARVRIELNSGSSLTGLPWASILPSPVVKTLSGTPAMVRITSDTTGHPPELVEDMFSGKDLPDGR